MKEVVRRRVLFCEDGAFRFANLGRGEELLNLISSYYCMWPLCGYGIDTTSPPAPWPWLANE
jgi:hypothetical protein